MFYISSWVALVVISLWVSLIAFIWAARSGQFSDQQRARYLALSDDLPAHPVRQESKRAPEGLALLFVIALGLAGLLALIVLTLYRLKG